MKSGKIFTGIFVLLVLIQILPAQITGSAVVVDSIDSTKLYPGQTASIGIEVKNTFDEDIEDVSFVLNLDNTLFTTSGSSEDSEDKIKDDDSETFNFVLKAPNDIKPGDYNIPYTITYVIEGESELIVKSGSFGITVSAKTELDFSVETKDNIIGKQGKISLKIINLGLGEIKFIAIEIEPQGYELISSDKIYVGTIDSDEDDYASFDVIFKDRTPILNAVVTYKDFENKDQIENVNLPIKVYTMEEALELGLIQKSNAGIYIGIIVVLVIAWFVYRSLKKRKKKKKEGR